MGLACLMRKRTSWDMSNAAKTAAPVIRWWRASHYQWTAHGRFGEDSLISPVQGATVREVLLPVHGTDFESALRLATKTLPEKGRDWAHISQAHEKSVREWCAQYGLLGVLSLGATEIGLAGATKEDSERGERYYAQDLFQRVGGCWSRKTRHAEQVLEVDAGPEDEPDAEQFGPTSARDWIRIPSDATTYRSYVTWADGEKEEGLDGVNRFFPRRQEETLLPKPLSKEFWQHYAEPVTSFSSELARFQNAVTSFRLGQPDRLYRFTDAATLRVQPDTPTNRLPSVVWEVASVLSAFALQMMLGASGLRVMKCARPKCPEIVFTRHSKKKWCSPRCRDAGRKQALRLKNKPKKQTRARARRRRPNA